MVDICGHGAAVVGQGICDDLSLLLPVDKVLDVASSS